VREARSASDRRVARLKRFVYMNHRLRQAEPTGPVVVVQDERGGTTEANEFELRFDGFKIGRVVFDPKGLKACKTHDVKAWLELAAGVDVEVVPVPRQEASQKKPNKVVKVDSLKISK